MLCYRCKNELGIGIAIEPPPNESLIPWPLSNEKTLKIIKVLKCPSCGHSEDININER